MMSEGAASNPPPGDPGDASALEDVVLDSSRTLMSAHPDEFGTKLQWTLGSVAEEVEADRCGAYQVERASGEATLVLIQEWTAEGVDARPPEARVLRSGTYPWLFEHLQGFQNAVASPLDALPAEATAIRGLLEADGVESALFLPLVSGWELLGAVVFESFDSPYGPGDRRIDLLRTFSDMLGHALAQTQRERELRRKNERLEEFASVVSHDLRNPLNVVQASIEFARDDPAPVHFDRGADAAARMEHIIEQVLTLARVGRDIGETEPVDPTAMARGAWESIHAEGATLEAFDVDPIVADRGRLREAFENLFRNAIEHGGDDVTVRVGPLAESPGFYVADDGSGIPEADRDRVLEQGYTTADGGTGLGLAIVARIVDAHGWEMAVDESDPGGARFEVRTDVQRGLGS